MESSLHLIHKSCRLSPIQSMRKSTFTETTTVHSRLVAQEATRKKKKKKEKKKEKEEKGGGLSGGGGDLLG